MPRLFFIFVLVFEVLDVYKFAPIITYVLHNNSGCEPYTSKQKNVTHFVAALYGESQEILDVILFTFLFMLFMLFVIWMLFIFYIVLVLRSLFSGRQKHRIRNMKGPSAFRFRRFS